MDERRQGLSILRAPSPRTPRAVLSQALCSGATASILSAIALALCGRIETGTAAGPNNGPSQWVWGRWAAYQKGPSVRHTLVGYCVHHVLGTGWALLHETVLGKNKDRQTGLQRIARGALTSATACFVDFQLTPLRLRPGFEVQLSRRSLFFVYAAFAVGLAVRCARR